MKNYLPRIADELLSLRLEAKGAVCIEGAKWCGKSTTAAQIAKSSVYLQDPSTRDQNIMMAKANSSRFLEGKTPKLIDEWQVIPFIWDAVRFEVDRRDEFGQFILTGSVTPADTQEIMHSGTGRIARMRMRPMSLFESQDSSGAVSLSALFSREGKEKKAIEGETAYSLDELAFLLCRGGWPKAVGQKERVALAQATDYFDDLLNTDFEKVDGVKRDKQRLHNLLRSYARNVSTQASYSTICSDMKANDAASLSEDTIASYINVLCDLFVIENLPAWNPNIRSKAAIRTSATRHFVDPSIGAAALGFSPSDLMNDFKTFGLMFESMCVRDLRIYAERLGGDVYHYRDKSGLEADVVIHLRNGDYGLVEVKLFAQEHIEEGAENLKKLAGRIDTDKMKSPSFLMVVTGTPYAYRREDGVIVAPLATLGP